MQSIAEILNALSKKARNATIDPSSAQSVNGIDAARHGRTHA